MDQSATSPYRSRAPQGAINEAISMLDTIGRPDLGTAVKRLWELCPPIWREEVIRESQPRGRRGPLEDSEKEYARRREEERRLGGERKMPTARSH